MQSKHLSWHAVALDLFKGSAGPCARVMILFPAIQGCHGQCLVVVWEQQRQNAGPRAVPECLPLLHPAVISAASRLCIAIASRSHLVPALTPAGLQAFDKAGILRDVPAAEEHHDWPHKQMLDVYPCTEKVCPCLPGESATAC